MNKLIVVLFAFSVSAKAAAKSQNPFENITDPVSGGAQGAQSVGFYSLGCLLNGEKYAVSNAQWEVVNTFRNRFYGHPSMAAFLTYLGDGMVKLHGKKVVTGDVGLPAGGPTVSGHASHQTGLDVDLRYRYYDAGKKMSDSERSNFAAPDIAIHEVEEVKEAGKKKYVLKTSLVGGKLADVVADSLRISAEHPAVERIFVSPPIKKALCARYANAGAYPAWLLKLSPYYGHADHFHVRIACPEGSTDCVKQAPVRPAADDTTKVGCAGSSLHWWYNQTINEDSFFREQVTELENPPPPKPPSWLGKMCELPKKCKDLVDMKPFKCPEQSVETPAQEIVNLY